MGFFDFPGVAEVDGDARMPLDPGDRLDRYFARAHIDLLPMWLRRGMDVNASCPVIVVACCGFGRFAVDHGFFIICTSVPGS
jgi:hypothetical protein